MILLLLPAQPLEVGDGFVVEQLHEEARVRVYFDGGDAAREDGYVCTVRVVIPARCEDKHARGMGEVGTGEVGELGGVDEDYFLAKHGQLEEVADGAGELAGGDEDEFSGGRGGEAPGVEHLVEDVPAGRWDGLGER